MKNPLQIGVFLCYNLIVALKHTYAIREAGAKLVALV